MTLINSDGIIWSALKKAHMNVNDVVSALRQQGYFCIDLVEFAVLETNGKVSVLPKVSTEDVPPELPYVLIAEGKIMERNLALLEIDRFDLFELIDRYDLLVEEILLFTLTDSGRTFMQPMQGRCTVGNTDLLSRGQGDLGN